MGLGRMRADLRLIRDRLAKREEERRLELEAERATRRSSGEMSLHQFVRKAWHVLEPNDSYQDSWHVGVICEHLEALTAAEILSLIINVPPGHAKSTLVSVLWFCWTWTINPFSRWICTSYSDSLVNRDALRSRDVLTSHWYRAHWGDRFRLRGDQNAKEKLLNDKQGYRIATTTGGRAGGERANYFVTDDPIKLDEAGSKVVRDKVNNWWGNTVATRGSDPKMFRKVVVMQRLHAADLSGYLMSEVGGYEHLCLPAEYEPKRIWYGSPDAAKPRDAIVPTKVQQRSVTARDPRTDPGELLWPARYDRAAVDSLRRHLRHDAPGQLQQRPGDDAGAIFRRQTFRCFSLRQTAAGPVFVLRVPDQEHPVLVPVELCRFFQCADTAAKVKKRSDYTAVVTAVLCPGGFLLIYHVVQAKIEIPHLMKFMRAMRFGPAAWDAENMTARPLGRWPRPLVRQMVEDASSGTGLLQAARAAGTPMSRLSAAGDKIEKAGPLAILYESGMVYHHAGTPWLQDFEDELVTFPNSAHDDRTDAASHCGRVATTDAVVRAGIANLEDVAAEYPGYREEQESVAEDARREARAWAMAAAGFGPTESDVKKAEAAADEGKELPTVKITVSGGELELPAD